MNRRQFSKTLAGVGLVSTGNPAAAVTSSAATALPEPVVSPQTEGAIATEVECYRRFRKKLIADRTRPTYHLVNPEGPERSNDPNCAIYWKGKYHLHYIYQDGGPAYAHVSSPDMLHWQWHRLTLSPDMVGHGMFSGTAFLNKDNVPTIIYHGKFSERNQLAFAMDDELEEWDLIHPIDPKIRSDQDGSLISHWDPDGWVEGDTTYALFGDYPGSGKKPTLMKSRNMENWEYVGLFLANEMSDVGPDEDLSCPNFFKIGNKHMLLCISHNRGCRYYLGKWKDEKFRPDFHARMNWHERDVFAPESLLTPDGRRVMWAWFLGGGNKLWGGIQSLPRELSLPADGVLRIQPLRELERLRYNETAEADITVDSGKKYRLKEIAGETIEFGATIRKSSADRYGVRVYCDGSNGGGLPIFIEPESRTFRVGSTAAPFELKPDEDLQLRIFLDRTMVEVFVNDRQALMRKHTHRPEDVGVCLFSQGGRMEVEKVTGWQMAATNPW